MLSETLHLTANLKSDRVAIEKGAWKGQKGRNVFGQTNSSGAFTFKAYVTWDLLLFTREHGMPQRRTSNRLIDKQFKLFRELEELAGSINYFFLGRGIDWDLSQNSIVTSRLDTFDMTKCYFKQCLDMSRHVPYTKNFFVCEWIFKFFFLLKAAIIEIIFHYFDQDQLEHDPGYRVKLLYFNNIIWKFFFAEACLCKEQYLTE